MAGGVADNVEIVVLAASADAFLRRDCTRIGRVSRPGEAVLNGTLPAFVNLQVGWFRGTSGEDGTTSCPSRAK